MNESTADFAAGTTLDEALRSSPLDRLETRILLCHALQLPRVALITQGQRVLTAQEAGTLNSLFERRLKGEPIAYIVGEREFYGLPFQVTPGVLIPRPETELLVELALERAPRHAAVLDMGTGSGAIAVALAHTRPDLHVTALDASRDALDVARRNALHLLPAHPHPVSFLHSDWYTAVEGVRFDLIVSNPPYIERHDQHLSQGDLRFEPLDALTDHADGLSALRIIIQGAQRHLNAGGWLLMEHGYDQAQAVRDLLAVQGMAQVQSWRDLAGIERVSGACLGPVQIRPI